MPSAKGLLYRAVDGITGGYLPSLAAMLPGDGTFEEREKLGRQLLDKSAERQGTLGDVLYGGGAVAGLAIPGGAALNGVRAVRAAKAASPMIASRLGMAKNAAKAVALGESKMGLAKRAAGVGLVGLVARNQANNRAPVSADEAFVAAIAPTVAAPAAPKAVAAPAVDDLSMRLTGNGMMTNNNLKQVLGTYAAANSNKQRLDAPERAASTLLEELNNEMSAAEGDPRITPSQLETMRAKRMQILMGLAGIDSSTLPVGEVVE